MQSFCVSISRAYRQIMRESSNALAVLDSCPTYEGLSWEFFSFFAVLDSCPTYEGLSWEFFSFSFYNQLDLIVLFITLARFGYVHPAAYFSYVRLPFFVCFVPRSPCFLKCVDVSYAAKWFPFRIIMILKVAAVFGTHSFTDKYCSDSEDLFVLSYSTHLWSGLFRNCLPFLTDFFYFRGNVCPNIKDVSWRHSCFNGKKTDAKQACLVGVSALAFLVACQ